MNRLTAWLSLFASTGTLFCCALPSLLVALGMGAAMAGLITTVPQIIWLSQYKTWVFAMSGIMLGTSGYLQYRAQFEPCPIDPVQADACTVGRKWSSRLFAFSVTIWLIGAFFAFLAPLMYT